MWLRLVVLFAILIYCEAHDPRTTRAVNQCCSKEYRACCFAKISQPGTVQYCSNDTATWTSMLACIEKKLYNLSMAPAESCCDLLYRDHCKAECHTRFQNPILSIDEKLGFSKFCMRDYDYQNIDCFTDSYRRLHFCYPQCVALTMLKIHHDKSYVFRPHDHCSYFHDPDRDLCIGREIDK